MATESSLRGVGPGSNFRDYLRFPLYSLHQSSTKAVTDTTSFAHGPRAVGAICVDNLIRRNDDEQRFNVCLGLLSECA